MRQFCHDRKDSMGRPKGLNSGYLGVLMVICLMAFTLYMAFAFPFQLLQTKQTETTEIKAVILLGMAGEESPTPDSYFAGEIPPDDLHFFGHGQLTNVS